MEKNIVQQWGANRLRAYFNMGIVSPYRWEDSVQSNNEIRLHVADGVANGLRPWFTKFSGMVYDQRWLDTVKSIYNMYADWEYYLRNETPIANVAMVYSQRSVPYYGGKSQGRKWRILFAAGIMH